MPHAKPAVLTSDPHVPKEVLLERRLHSCDWNSLHSDVCSCTYPSHRSVPGCLKHSSWLKESHAARMAWCRGPKRWSCAPFIVAQPPRFF